MGQSCYTGKEFNELVKALGLADANVATKYYQINKGNKGKIPSVKEAKSLLYKAKILDEDQKLVIKSDIYKKKKAVEQLVLLNKLMLRTDGTITTPQKVAITKLIKVTNDYVKILDANIEANKTGGSVKKMISVSNLKGKSDFKGNASDYEAFRQFGNLAHNILEHLQMESLEKGTNVMELFTKERFDKEYDDFVKANSIDIKNIDKDLIFQHIKNLLGIISVHSASGNLVIPEITVIGKTNKGDDVLGRLDLLVLNTDGTASILDFKTKRVQNFVKKSFDGRTFYNFANVFGQMAIQEFPIVKETGTSNEFLLAGQRSTFDEWMLQLDIYGNILEQQGLSVKDKAIATLLYDVDDDYEYHGGAVHLFTDQDYYEEARTRNIGSKNYNFVKKNFKEKDIIKLKEIVNKVLPKDPDAQEIDKDDDKKVIKEHDFSPTTKQMNLVIKKLKNTLEGKRDEIENKLRNLKDTEANKAMIDILNTRKKTLVSFKAIIDNYDENSEAILKSINFFKALEDVSLDLNNMGKLSLEIIEKFRNAKSDEEAGNYLKQIHIISQKINEFKEMVRTFNIITNEAAQNEENELDENSDVRKKIAKMQEQLEVVYSVVREAGLHSGIKIFQVFGKTVYERISEDRRQAIQPKLDNINKQIEQLRNGKSLSMFANMKQTLISTMSKAFKKDKIDQADVNIDIELQQLQKLERLKLKYEAVLKGFEYDEESIKLYFDGITDPNSIVHIGNNEIYNEDVILQGWVKMDQAVASASNSDRAVSAPTILLKNAYSQANVNFMNDERIKRLDVIRQKLLKKYSREELNQMTSDWRDVKHYNRDNNSIDTEQKLFLTKPYSLEYENTFRELKINVSVLQKEASNIKKKLNELYKQRREGKISDEELEQVKQEKLDISKDLSTAKSDFNNFVVQNSQMPYVDDYYTLQNLLPDDIKQKTQALYLEREAILFNVGGEENMFHLTEEDFDELKLIDIEIKKLREDAKQRDPKYAEYLDKYNDLYENDVNENYFMSRRQSAVNKYGGENTDGFKKWEKENTLTKPTSEWYNKMAILYEKKQEISKMLPKNEFSDELEELFKERTKIVKPYKINGKITPKYMDEYTIEQYDKIQSRIDEILELVAKDKSKDKTLIPIFQSLKAISLEISQLSQKQLSENYTEDFDNRTHELTQLWKNVEIAENNLSIAEKNHTSNPTKQTDEKLMYSKEDVKNITGLFLAKEKRYEIWYNKHHTNKYESISLGNNSETSAKPKEYNYEKVPNSSVADKYMETVPNPKYYSIKKLRKENWYFKGRHLSSMEIEAYKNDDSFDIQTEIDNSNLVVKQGAYNEEYQESVDEIPLPKGIISKGNNEYEIAPGYENSVYIDDKFKHIKQDAELNEYYNALSDVFLGMQQKIEGKKIGYMIPGYASTLVERINSQDNIADIFKSEGIKFIDKVFKIEGSEQDKSENVYGTAGDQIRLKHSFQLPKEMQTEDALGAILKYSMEGHYNMAMQEVAPVVDSYIDYLKVIENDLVDKINSGKSYKEDSVTGESVEVDMQKRLDEIKNIISIVEFEKRKFVQGQTDVIKNRAVKKILNNIFQYTSFIRIGFDVANQIKNNFAGNTQAFIAASSHNGDNFSRRNWLVGKKKLYGEFLPNYFKDYGKISELSLSTMLYRAYNPVQKDQAHYLHEVSGSKARKLADKALSPMELGYLLQDKGESEIGITVMYAVMDNYHYPVIESFDEDNKPIYKVDEEGNTVTVPVYDAYTINDKGQMVRRADVDFSEEQENFIRNLIYSEMKKEQGNYAKSDMTKFEESITGKLTFYFRKFFVPMLLERFGYMRDNWEGGQIAMGYWRAVNASMKIYGVGQTMKELVLGANSTTQIKNMMDNMIIGHSKGDSSEIKTKEMTDFYIRKIAKARRDAAAMGILSMLSMIALAYVRQKDDDDEELSMLEGNMFRILWSVKGETLSMFPVGGGSEEYIRNFSTAIPFIREASKINKMLQHGLKYGLLMSLSGGEEPDDFSSQYYKQLYKDAFYVKQSGPYEAGTSKMYKDFMDLSGMRNFRDFFDPSSRIDQLKRNQ